jgi:hypothetical protein
MNSHADVRALDDAAWNLRQRNAIRPVQMGICFDHKSIVAEQLFAHNRKSNCRRRPQKMEGDLFL